MQGRSATQIITPPVGLAGATKNATTDFKVLIDFEAKSAAPRIGLPAAAVIPRPLGKPSSGSSPLCQTNPSFFRQIS